MHLRILVFILVLAFTTNARAQKPVENNSNQDSILMKRIDELEQIIKEMEAKITNITVNRNTSDSSQTIIIDGKGISISGDFDERLKRLSQDSLLLGEGFKIYSNKDSMIINIGGMKVRVRDDDHTENDVVLELPSDSTDEDDDPIKTQIFSLRLGLNNFLFNNSLNKIPGYQDLNLINGKSLNVGIGIVNVRMNLIKHYLRFNAGLLYDINNYRFNTDASLIPKIDSVAFSPKATGVNVSKNKLISTYIMLPVNFTFTSNSEVEKAFRFSAGFRVGYRIGSLNKLVVDNKKEKIRDDYNLNDLRYGLTASVGYSLFRLYVDYDMNTLFRDGVAPQLNPVQIGIVLVGF
ncbi:hypothetical protein LBMAG25_08540 [Bacteroidota bacterium]|nr:hypothetical protein LBMAG25_08540 [Bacteroidota bacterium]